ncbi:MAG: amidohydrolase family protein [Luteitalea sp.]|nr:amidohydrolase family protein [Luteitalea sp.]
MCGYLQQRCLQRHGRWHRGGLRDGECSRASQSFDQLLRWLELTTELGRANLFRPQRDVQPHRHPIQAVAPYRGRRHSPQHHREGGRRRSCQANDLPSLDKALDRFSNMYLDTSAYDYEAGRQPRTAAKFLAKYRDRVLFGTDLPVEKRQEKMYEMWWRLFETADEFMPGQSWWRNYGLELPDSVLEPFYRKNARRLLNWEKSSA